MSATPTPADAPDGAAADGTHSTERPLQRSHRRLTPGVVVFAAAVALCVALAFSFVALRLADRNVGVDPAVALNDLSVRPVVPPGTPVATEGSPAPPVEFQYLDGGRQPIEELRGTPLLLNFWSSTCPPCITEMPVFQRVAERAGDTVRVVGVDVVDTPEAAQRQIARTGVTYRNAADPSGTMFAVFGGTSLPRTVLVGADGRVLETIDGALDDEALADLLRRNGIVLP